MYGSQYHSTFALTCKRPNTQELQLKTGIKGDKKISKNVRIFLGVLILLSLSSLSYAGPSQPRLPGGNGNVIGR